MSIHGTGDGLPTPAGPFKDLASFSAEQTARFFGGGELGRARFTDPEVQAAQDRQRAAMREAWRTCVPILRASLRKESEATERRLGELYSAAAAGDQHAKRLLMTMVAELVNLAYSE